MPFYESCIKEDAINAVTYYFNIANFTQSIKDNIIYYGTKTKNVKFNKALLIFNKRKK